MRVMRWIALWLAFGGGCAGPHIGGAVETSVAIGVCFDDGSRTQIHDAVSEQLARQDVEFVGCLGATVAAGRAPQLEWRRPREFEGVREAAALPQRPADARFGYSFERGPLHLTVIETAEPMPANSPAYLWLMEDLSLSKQPWKVVILSRPIVSPSPIRVDEDRLDLAALLSREGVALAISTGGPAYFRTARIGDSRVESVRFVLLGGDFAGEPLKPAPEWTVCTITEPCFCLLDVKTSRLRWTALDLQGRLLDLLDVAAGEGPVGRAPPSAGASGSPVAPDDNTPGSPAANAPGSPAAKPAAPIGKISERPVQSFTWSEVIASEREQTRTEE